jgi:hypothetical protein
MTRFQIADQEKIPVDNPLMVSLLAELPSRQCSSSSWKEAGEMEYYYQGRSSLTKKESKLREVATLQEVKVQDAKVDQLLVHVDPMEESMQAPQKALEDGVVKKDPDVMEQEEVEAKYKDTLAKVRKMTKAMNDLSYDGSCSAAKGKAVIKEKPYLQDMLGTLREQLKTFNEAKDKIISEMTCLADMDPDPEGLLLAQQLLQDGSNHIEAFKSGVFCDVKANVK